MEKVIIVLQFFLLEVSSFTWQWQGPPGAEALIKLLNKTISATPLVWLASQDSSSSLWCKNWRFRSL